MNKKINKLPACEVLHMFGKPQELFDGCFLTDRGLDCNGANPGCQPRMVGTAGRGELDGVVTKGTPKPKGYTEGY
jgi:hypothetical protein